MGTPWNGRMCFSLAPVEEGGSIRGKFTALWASTYNYMRLSVWGWEDVRQPSPEPTNSFTVFTQQSSDHHQIFRRNRRKGPYLLGSLIWEHPGLWFQRPFYPLFGIKEDCQTGLIPSGIGPYLMATVRQCHKYINLIIAHRRFLKINAWMVHNTFLRDSEHSKNSVM